MFVSRKYESGTELSRKRKMVKFPGKFAELVKFPGENGEILDSVPLSFSSHEDDDPNTAAFPTTVLQDIDFDVDVKFFTRK